MPEAGIRGRRHRLVKAALLLGVATITSRVLGYSELAMMTAQIGQNRYTDSFTAALSVPNFAYNLLVAAPCPARPFLLWSARILILERS